MNMSLRDYWPGHGEPRVEVIDRQGRRLATFPNEAEARAWMRQCGGAA